MPNNTHKSAAVPFVNQKGERSMKRVKVERYVAGKKPAYAKDDEDEEYYTTDDEAEGEEEEEVDDDEQYYEQLEQRGRALHYNEDDADDDDDDDDAEDDNGSQGAKAIDSKPDHPESNAAIKSEPGGANRDSGEDSEDDDPRFRRLKQIETKVDVAQLIRVQTKSQFERSNNVVIDEDDDEQEIRRRHAAARKRQIEEPIGPQAVFGDINDQKLDPNKPLDCDLDEPQATKRIETDDFLKDLKLTGIKPSRDAPKSEDEKAMEERRLKESLRQARDEATFKLQIHKKIEEDIRLEREREALAKGDIGARDMNAVNTDDEDEELAYEEWKLREIKRVLRDRTERANVRV